MHFSNLTVPFSGASQGESLFSSKGCRIARRKNKFNTSSEISGLNSEDHREITRKKNTAHKKTILSGEKSILQCMKIVSDSQDRMENQIKSSPMEALKCLDTNLIFLPPHQFDCPSSQSTFTAFSCAINTLPRSDRRKAPGLLVIDQSNEIDGKNISIPLDQEKTEKQQYCLEHDENNSVTCGKDLNGYRGMTSETSKKTIDESICSDSVKVREKAENDAELSLASPFHSLDKWKDEPVSKGVHSPALQKDEMREIDENFLEKQVTPSNIPEWNVESGHICVHMKPQVDESVSSMQCEKTPDVVDAVLCSKESSCCSSVYPENVAEPPVNRHLDPSHSKTVPQSPSDVAKEKTSMERSPRFSHDSLTSMPISNKKYCLDCGKIGDYSREFLEAEGRGRRSEWIMNGATLSQAESISLRHELSHLAFLAQLSSCSNQGKSEAKSQDAAAVRQLEAAEAAHQIAMLERDQEVAKNRATDASVWKQRIEAVLSLQRTTDRVEQEKLELFWSTRLRMGEWLEAHRAAIHNAEMENCRSQMREMNEAVEALRGSLKELSCAHQDLLSLSRRQSEELRFLRLERRQNANGKDSPHVLLEGRLDAHSAEVEGMETFESDLCGEKRCVELREVVDKLSKNQNLLLQRVRDQEQELSELKEQRNKTLQSLEQSLAAERARSAELIRMYSDQMESLHSQLADSQAHNKELLRQRNLRWKEVS